MDNAMRINPLDERMFGGNGVSLAPVGPRERISLRADEKTAKALGKALGVDLPFKPGSAVSKGGKTALWIGPDEWLLIGPDNGSISTTLSQTGKQVFSIADISHRNTAVTITGPNSTAVLNSGCPRDLSLAAFPVKSCSRTVFGKAEVVLWRIRKEEFHLECWRSFSDYVWKYLADAARSA